MHFTLPPGFVGGKQFHPGAVYICIIAGKLTAELKGRTNTVFERKI
ncbi:MAG: hypothetical protein O7B79_04100 [SAR324 cluster bacterium]|nr:hypothetical protein [SAR324 cluster bacterium]